MVEQNDKQMKVISIPIQGGSIDFLDALTLLFIGLKLGTDKLDDWTWVEVLSPLWLPFMLTWFLKLCIITFGIGKETEK